MGTGKPVERTENIEIMAPREFAESCSRIRTSLNQLEDKLAGDFPAVNETTAVSHRQVQEALYKYYNALTDAIGIERIRISEINPAESNPYAKLFPNFVGYLKQFGEVGIGSHIDSFQGVCRIGVFLKKGDDKHKLLGFLGIRRYPEQKEYSGYVPIKVSERKFHGCSVYHLSTPDLGAGNFAFVRLVAEKRANEDYERVDRFGNRKIKFP
jgi:hypothetical protein